MAEPSPATGFQGEPTSRGALEASGGVSLAWARWDVPNPRGRIVILHGYGEHGERYAHTAAWLQSLGWSVASLDQRGFGRSGGPRGDAHGLGTFVEDFRGFLLAERRAGLPLVILAHSFGALVALATLAQHPDVAEGAILSSPSLALRGFPRSLRIIQKVLLRLAPHLSLELPNAKDLVCSDPEMVARYWADPLCHRRITAAFTQVFAEGFALLVPLAPTFRRPCLVLEAGEDTVADPDAASAFWDQVPPGLVERHRVAGFRHEVFHDLHRSEAQDLAARWLTRGFESPSNRPNWGTPAPFKPCEDERG